MRAVRRRHQAFFARMLPHGFAAGPAVLLWVSAAKVAELADAPDLGSGGSQPCGFASRLSHHSTRRRVSPDASLMAGSGGRDEWCPERAQRVEGLSSS